MTTHILLRNTARNEDSTPSNLYCPESISPLTQHFHILTQLRLVSKLRITDTKIA